MVIATPLMALYTTTMAAALADCVGGIRFRLYAHEAEELAQRVGWRHRWRHASADWLDFRYRKYRRPWTGIVRDFIPLANAPLSRHLDVPQGRIYGGWTQSSAGRSRSDATTRVHIFGYVVALVAVSLYLAELDWGGIVTVVGSAALGVPFLWKAWRGLRIKGDAAWARDLFLYSLLYLSGLFVVMAVDHVL